MTLAQLRPGRMNSGKLFAFALIALGIMAFVYEGLLGTTLFASITGTIVLVGGIVVLIIERNPNRRSQR